jgi:hypothetical protein
MLRHVLVVIFIALGVAISQNNETSNLGNRRIELRGPVDNPYLVFVNENGQEHILYYLPEDPGSRQLSGNDWIPLMVQNEDFSDLEVVNIDSRYLTAVDRKNSLLDKQPLFGNYHLAYNYFSLYYFEGLIPTQPYWQIATLENIENSIKWDGALRCC